MSVMGYSENINKIKGTFFGMCEEYIMTEVVSRQMAEHEIWELAGGYPA